jgi:hypothetical protein
MACNRLLSRFLIDEPRPDGKKFSWLLYSSQMLAMFWMYSAIDVAGDSFEAPLTLQSRSVSKWKMRVVGKETGSLEEEEEESEI